MIDPSIIDERIRVARDRDVAVFEKLKNDCARLVVVDQYQSQQRQLSLDNLVSTLRPARYSESGNSSPNRPTFPTPENGSFAYQMFSSIAFCIDARAELKLLELIASPDFYAALMRSAAEIKEN